MNALESLKIALNKEIKALTTIENNLRNGHDEDYEQTVNRLELQGYIEGLRYAITLLEQGAN